jgi:hypothetical protein
MIEFIIHLHLACHAYFPIPLFGYMGGCYLSVLSGTHTDYLTVLSQVG